MKTKWKFRLITAVALTLMATGIQAAKIYPDDCPSMTLQQCIDSDNGGTGAFFITVKPGNYVDQDFTVFSRTGWIVGSPGEVGRPVFSDSQWNWYATGTSSSGVRGIEFNGQSRTRIYMTGTVNAGETGSITVEDNVFDLNVNAFTLGEGAISIRESGLNGSGNFQVKIKGNTVKANFASPPTQSPLGLINIEGFTTTATVDIAVFENHLQTNREDTPGLLVRRGSANVDMIVSQNEFRGARAIRFIDGADNGNLRFVAFYNLFADRYADGTRPVLVNDQVISEMNGSAADIDIGFYWNTFDGRWDLLDFSGHSITATSHDLRLFDNIFTQSPQGSTFLLWIPGTSTATVSGANNVIGPGVTHNDYVPDSTDLVATDPLYVAPPARFALRAGSPAIDTTGNADLAFGLTQLAWFGNPVPDFLAAPHVDLDGFRRVIDGDGDGTANADAGAYEWGDRVITHEASANNTSGSGHISYVHDTRLRNDADAVGVFTHLYRHEDTPANYYDQATGWWKSTSWWTIYNDDNTVAMTPGTVFSIFHPTGDRGAGTNGFRGLIDVQNGAAAATSVDTGLTERNLAVFVRHVFQAGAAVYDNHPLEVYYDGSTWRIYHADGTDIPANAAYTVYYQQPSQNVFMATPGIGRIGNFSGAGILIQHPLIASEPNCVTPVIQQVALGGLFGTGLGDMPHNTGYDTFGNLGAIYAEDGTSPFVDYNIISGGTGYFVMIDPQQAFECQDRIYKDDMDH